MKPFARIIRPGFFIDEDLAALPLEARVLFAGLWILADKAGRLEDKPKRIKYHIFPYDDYDVNALLDSLSPQFIIRYDGYIQIRNWLKHQKVHWNETESEIPEPTIEQQDNLNSSHIGPCKELHSSLKVVTVQSNSISKSRSKSNSNTRISEIVTLVLEDLNLILGTNYKDSTGPYQLQILNRQKEGYTLEDFKLVHRGQYQEWAHDPKMSKYLTPATLYRPGHFPKYLENAKRPEAPQISDATKNALTAAARFVANDKKEISYDGSN